MRIGLFTDTYYPQINGVATSVFLLKKYLELEGHEVFVCTTSDPKAEANEYNTYRTKSLPFVSERRFGSFYSPRLAALAQSHKPDIIHTHTEFPLGVFGRALSHNFKVPHIHTYHTIYEDYTHFVVKFGSLNTAARAVTRYMSKVFCNSANEVIVPTDKVRKLLESYGVVRPIHVEPTGIEIDKFEQKNYTEEEVEACRQELGISKDHFIILNIGRVSEEKKIDFVMRGLAPQLQEHADWRFVVIGNGPELEEYKALAQELGVQTQILFAGARPWDQIGKYYQLGDVFISASQSETQGLTYIESMAAGLPVVARRDPCLDGVVIEGENGSFFEDYEELQAAVLALYEDVELRKRMSEHAQMHARIFSAPEFARRLAHVYEGAISRFDGNISMQESFFQH